MIILGIILGIIILPFFFIRNEPKECSDHNHDWECQGGTGSGCNKMVCRKCHKIDYA